MTVRMGVMGGTFDPIHHGHLVAASEVAHRLDLDDVVFVPTGRPWQKSHRTVTEPETRFQMTVIATAADPRFSVSRVDIDRPGPTYTVDTLRDLQAEHPRTQLFFITGADALSSIGSWRDPDAVMSLAQLVAVTRPGHAVDTGLPSEAVTTIEIPGLEISSTQCRARVARAAPITYLVPAGVEVFIAKTGLYRDDAA